MDDMLEDRNVENSRAEFRRKVGGGRDNHKHIVVMVPNEIRRISIWVGNMPTPQKLAVVGRIKEKVEGHIGKEREKEKEKVKVVARIEKANAKAETKAIQVGKAETGKAKGKGGEKGKTVIHTLEDFKKHPNPNNTKNLCKFHFTYQGCMRHAQGLCNR